MPEKNENPVKSKAEQLQEKLVFAPKNSALLLSDKEYARAELFCESYKHFLNLAKTEREAVGVMVSIARERGYRAFDPQAKYQPGDKFFYNNHEKSLILCTIGEKPLEMGARIVASHIDAPRIDLKPRPLYEEAQLAMFRTHYYGGIKKYQWVAIPLALHGVILRRDGEKITVAIGEHESDPVFTITDLLPHLAEEQMKRTLARPSREMSSTCSSADACSATTRQASASSWPFWSCCLKSTASSRRISFPPS
jgi:aspartyl aminopeptidase